MTNIIIMFYFKNKKVYNIDFKKKGSQTDYLRINMNNMEFGFKSNYDP